MSLTRCARRLPGLLLSLFLCVPAVHAAAPAATDPVAMEALTRAVQAVVGLEATATEGAGSADTLGRQRRGSGVVIDPDGLILTIGYLILEVDHIQVTTHDRRVFPARAIAYDLATGFGLVRPVLPLRDIAPASLGNAADLPPRATLVAVSGGEGARMGLTQLLDKRPFSGYWEYHIDNALFTSPPLPGHSGAALFNRGGELLGIGSLFLADVQANRHGIPGNMFVPVDLLKPVLAEMQQTGSTRVSRRPWLGINSAVHEGQLRILRVTRDSPAARAGLAPGDVVLAIEGEPVNTLEAFYRKLWERPQAEADVLLTVRNGTETRQVTVRSIDRTSTMRRPGGI